SMQAARVVERLVHEALAGDRVGGEWFKTTVDMARSAIVAKMQDVIGMDGIQANRPFQGYRREAPPCPPPIHPPVSGGDTPLSPGDTPRTKKKEPKDRTKLSPDGDSPLQALGIYNQIAGECGWPQSSTVTPGRRVMLLARIKQCRGVEEWKNQM